MVTERQIAVVMYPGVTTLELVGTASTLNGLRWLDYDPQPPFGRLDYEDMSLTLRARRAATYLLTLRPKQLTRRERIAG